MGTGKGEESEESRRARWRKNPPVSPPPSPRPLVGSNPESLFFRFRRAFLSRCSSRIAVTRPLRCVYARSPLSSHDTVAATCNRDSTRSRIAGEILRPHLPSGLVYCRRSPTRNDYVRFSNLLFVSKLKITHESITCAARYFGVR